VTPVAKPNCALYSQQKEGRDNKIMMDNLKKVLKLSLSLLISATRLFITQAYSPYAVVQTYVYLGIFQPVVEESAEQSVPREP